MNQSDDELFEELRRATERADAPPRHVVDRAKAAYALRSVGVELAQLVADTGAVEAGMRSSGVVRQLSFQASASSIEVEIVGNELVGQLVPARSGDIEVQSDVGEATVVTTDAVGQFRVELPDGDRMRVVTATAGSPIVTDWFAR